MEEAVEGRLEWKKKRKRVEVEMEVLSETIDRIAPIVGYFPSGYDPHNATSAAAAGPSIRVFRNQKHSSRLELVVSPQDSNVEFVGTSYSGEAAGARLCTYTLGVLDKETQTLKIVPIAANNVASFCFILSFYSYSVNGVVKLRFSLFMLTICWLCGFQNYEI